MTTLWIPRAAGLFAAFCMAAPSLCADDDLPVRAYAILQKNCFTCHGAARTSGLDLRGRDRALAGGVHGRAIVPSRPDESRLYRMVSHAVQPSMPPAGKLSEADLETLRSWIAAGASFQGLEATRTSAS